MYVEKGGQGLYNRQPTHKDATGLMWSINNFSLSIVANTFLAKYYLKSQIILKIKIGPASYIMPLQHSFIALRYIRLMKFDIQLTF